MTPPFILALPGFGEITCTTQNLVYTVGASGGATVSVSLTNGSATTCTDTVPFITLTSCSELPLPTAGVATGNNSSDGTIVFTNLFVKCAVQGAATFCYYKATSATGTYSNTGATLRFSAVATTHTPPAGAMDDQGMLCGNNGAVTLGVDDQQLLAAPTTPVFLTNVP